MTWSYDIANLSAVSSSTLPLTKVRLLIGDTTQTLQLMSDEEIEHVIGTRTSLNYVAADLCDLLAAKFAVQVNTDNSELRVSAAARHKHYMALADRYRRNGPGDLPGGEADGGMVAEGYAGGTSKVANQALADNTDNVLPPAGVGQDDYPGNSGYDDNDDDAYDYFR